MRGFENVLDDQEDMVSTFIPKERTPEEEILLAIDVRKEAIRRCIMSGNSSGPSLYSLLTDASLDKRGPDTPIDSQGRTALMMICDPEYHSKLNDSKMENLHSLEVLEDVFYAGCRWEAPDKWGRTPNDVAPDWLKKAYNTYKEMRKT